MSLTLKFPSNGVSRSLKEAGLDEITFHQISSIKIVPPNLAAVVVVTEKLWRDIRHNEYHFKGKITLPNEPSPCEVIVKMMLGHTADIYSDILQCYTQEAKFYLDHLLDKQSLYGNGVPRIYGCYETNLTWKMSERDRPMDCACIVFQYYGSSENLSWSTGAGISDFGLKALKLLFELHKNGVWHSDYTNLNLDRNITCLDGEPFITDYSQARIHDCRDKKFELPTRLFELDPDTLQCGELLDFYDELRSRVAPRRFHWYGYDLSYDRIESLESIFLHKRRKSSMDVPIEDQWDHAVNNWEFLCANWYSYHDGEAPPVGDTSFDAFEAKYGLDGIIYDDDYYEYYEVSDEEESEASEHM